MNKVILIGRLTRDAEVRYAGNSAVAKFTLAVPKENNSNEADFIPCEAWGKSAEWYQKYGKQGLKLCVEGSLKIHQYTKQDGSKATATAVTVYRQEFCEAKKAEQTPPAEKAPAEPFMDIADGLDDVGLPFN